MKATPPLPPRQYSRFLFKWGAGLVVPLLVMALLAPQVWHFAQRDELNRPVWDDALPFWRTLESWELSLLDRRFAERGPISPRSRDRIAIVGIDEASLRNLGQWPFPRHFHAELVEKLRRAGARVIGLDIGFDSYQGGKTDPRTGQWILSPDDRELQAAIERAGNVALASHLETGKSDNQAKFQAPATPIDEFDGLVPDLSVSFVPRDTDRLVRRYPFRLQSPSQSAPFGGFAPFCAAISQNLVRGDDLNAYQNALKTGKWPALNGTRQALPLHQSAFGTAKTLDNQTLIATTPLWFWGAPGSVFPSYSYFNVLRHLNDEELKKAFAGRVVLVGATATILKDVFPAPAFDAKGENGALPEMAGVEIHATMLAMLLDGQFLHSQSLGAMLATLFLFTLAASVWTTLLGGPISVAARRVSAWWARKKWPGRVHDAVWLGLYAILSALPLIAFWRFTVWELAARHVWIAAAYPLLGAALASTGTLLLLFGSESARRRKTETQMARIVAPDVMEEILAHPEAEYPRPRRVAASILFTDLDGFTAYAAAREPEEVVDDLNALLTRIHPIIAFHGGSIDKYIGDSVMAFFGAPLPRADHAAQALRCAIAIQDECARFRAETDVPFWMRIGVHSGEVLVGSIGSMQHFNYTVIGDAVNIASRLESKNKEFGSRIICSAQTLDAAPNVARVHRAHTGIRGKADAMEVYLVLGPAEEPPRGKIWGDNSAAGQSVVISPGELDE